MRVNLNKFSRNFINFKNLFLKADMVSNRNIMEQKSNKFDDSLIVETSTWPHRFQMINSVFLRWPSKNSSEILYEMRRDRGGTMRKKLNRERRKKERKHKKENTDVYR